MSNFISVYEKTAPCLYVKNDIGSETIYNTCTGAQLTVTWGAMDWIGAGFVVLLMIIFVTVAILGIYTIIRIGR
jgi:hypothetical protein